MAEIDLQTCRLESEKRWSELAVRMKSLEDTNEVMFQRLNKQAALMEDIQELSTSVSILANNMKSMLEEQQRQNRRLEELEKKPAKRWDAVVDKIIMTVVVALLTFILIKLGLPA